MRTHAFNHIWLLATPWIVGHQAPLSMRFSRQEYWSRVPFPPPDFPTQGSNPLPPVSSALAGGFLTTQPPGKPLISTYHVLKRKCFFWRISLKMGKTQETLPHISVRSHAFGRIRSCQFLCCQGSSQLPWRFQDTLEEMNLWEQNSGHYQERRKQKSDFPFSLLYDFVKSCCCCCC